MMINVDPGALTSVAVLAGSVVAGLAARRGIARLDQRRDGRVARREAEPVPAPARSSAPYVRPAVPAGGRR